MSSERERLVRWRLVLGSPAEDALGGLGGEAAGMDEALGYLYDREGADRNVRGGDGGGGLGPSTLSVPDWIDRVHGLFPRETIERLERDALDRYALTELIADVEALQRVQPNVTLLKAVLRTKHLMSQEVLQEARKLVRKVVQALLQRLARPVRSPFVGTRDPRRSSRLKVARNFDAKATIRHNLRRWDPEGRRLFIETPRFNSRVRRSVDRWQIVLLVDQSGSMVDSVIHAAITASIFWGLRELSTHLVAFDTNVVDLTGECSDPVETLMKVQLGGGTDIGQALRYAEQLVRVPRRCLVVLITDFYEGAPVDRLLASTQRLVESGVTLLGLAALDPDAVPSYDRDLARRMVDLGAEVGAMSPGELAAWVADKVKA